MTVTSWPVSQGDHEELGGHASGWEPEGVSRKEQKVRSLPAWTTNGGSNVTQALSG